MTMTTVKRLGLEVEFSEGTYKEYKEKTELEKDNYFKGLLEAFEVKGERVKTRYEVGGVAFDDAEKALRHKGRQEVERLVGATGEGIERDIEEVERVMGVGKTRAIEMILKERYNITNYEELKRELANAKKRLGKSIRADKMKARGLKVIK